MINLWHDFLFIISPIYNFVCHPNTIVKAARRSEVKRMKKINDFFDDI